MWEHTQHRKTHTHAVMELVVGNMFAVWHCSHVSFVMIVEEVKGCNDIQALKVNVMVIIAKEKCTP